MTPLNIALIRQRYTAFGGAERFVTRAATALTRQDVELTLITRRWETNGTTRALICDPFYIGNLWRDWGFARRVCKTLAQEHFDLVQSHERIACCDVFRAGDGVHREWLRQRRRTLSTWGKFSVALNPYHRFMLNAETKLFTSDRLKAVICISEMVKQDILRHFPIDPAKLHVIYNGIDNRVFHPELRPSHSHHIRQELGIPLDTKVFLFVGSGFERKGLAIFLRALAELDYRAHGVVVGKDKHAAKFAALAKNLGILSRVHFLGGQKDVKPYYGAADALVFPTLYEPFGNVALEALACGVPVITSTTSGAAELIQEGVNGYVRDALDADGFRQAMAALMVPDNHNRARMAARKTAEPFTLERMGRQMIGFYEQLLT